MPIPFVLHVTHQTQNRMTVMVAISPHVVLAMNWVVTFRSPATQLRFDWALAIGIMMQIKT
jgi:hypothetical protein